MERREAPGRIAAPLQAGCVACRDGPRGPPSHPRQYPQSPGDRRCRGARGQQRRPLRLPGLHRDVIVGHRTPLRHQTPRSTTPSMSKASTNIRVPKQAGITFFPRPARTKRRACVSLAA